MRTANRLTTRMALAWSLVPGSSCWLLAGESAEIETSVHKPGGVQELAVNINHWFWAPSMEVRHKYLDAMSRLGIGHLDTINNVHPGFPVTLCSTLNERRRMSKPGLSYGREQ